MQHSSQHPNNRPQQQANSSNHAQPQNTHQGGNQVTQPIDKGYIKVARKYIEKKVNGQVVYLQGTNQAQLTPLYKVIGEVVRWPAQNSSGFFDKLEMYPGNTILDSLTEGVIDWQSQNNNQGGRG